MEICPCCKQAIPETTVVTPQQIQEAETELIKFIGNHPARNFWVRNSMLGMIVSICIATVAMILGVTWIVTFYHPVHWILLIWFASFVLWALLAFVLYTRPLRKFAMHNQAVRNAFALRYKVHAEYLGLKAAWK